MLFVTTCSKKLDYLSYKKLLKGALFGVFLLSGGMTDLAYAQDRDMISMQNQIEALKAQVSQLQQMPSSSSGSDRKSKGSSQSSGDVSGLLPELLTRVNNLEDQQRIMRGQLDDLTNQVQTKIDLLNKKIDDANFAAGGSGGGSSASAGAGAAAATASVAEPAAPKAVSSGNSLKDGQQALMSKNYSESESIARNILNTPQGKKSVPAHFLLAQSLAGQQRYKDASVGYFDIYKKFPDSTRAPEALLGVSITLLKNGDSNAACQALGLLNNKYPNASSRIKGAASNLHKKAKCS